MVKGREGVFVKSRVNRGGGGLKAPVATKAQPGSGTAGVPRRVSGVEPECVRSFRRLNASR